mmetsp:Transcript_18997/g.31070  ORF Transcript_18997/g.31070 Transcript_18997/m.31070 type:complete len:263 (-) Transcript_18997:1090-1878(-)
MNSNILLRIQGVPIFCLKSCIAASDSSVCFQSPCMFGTFRLCGPSMYIGCRMCSSRDRRTGTFVPPPPTKEENAPIADPIRDLEDDAGRKLFSSSLLVCGSPALSRFASALLKTLSKSTLLIFLLRRYASRCSWAIRTNPAYFGVPFSDSFVSCSTALANPPSVLKYLAISSIIRSLVVLCGLCFLRSSGGFRTSVGTVFNGVSSNSGRTAFCKFSSSPRSGIVLNISIASKIEFANSSSPKSPKLSLEESTVSPLSSSCCC